MIIIVCGGRNYSDRAKVKKVLDSIHEKMPISLVVEGGALGADRIASYWAGSTGIKSVRVHADWKKYGDRAAGPIRNKKMLDDNPDVKLVVAFPGGRGTGNMKRQAREKGIEVMEIKD